MKNIQRFNKIPLKHFIDVLILLYDDGADYVDLFGIEGDLQDEIGIIVKEEYMSSQEEDNEEEESTSFNEENLKDLI